MKDKLIKISDTLKLNNNKSLTDSLIKEYEYHAKRIEAMKKINTDKVEPMVRIDDAETVFLREDTPGETLDKEIILNNAPMKKDGFIALKKVVK